MEATGWFATLKSTTENIAFFGPLAYDDETKERDCLATVWLSSGEFAVMTYDEFAISIKSVGDVAEFLATNNIDPNSGWHSTFEEVKVEAVG